MSNHLRVLARGACVLSAAMMLAVNPAASQSDISVNGGPSDRTVTRAMQVSYADLDLSAAAGQRRLARRIEEAAAAVCDDGDLSDHYAVRDYQRCRRVAIDQASHGTDRITVASRN